MDRQSRPGFIKLGSGAHNRYWNISDVRGVLINHYHFSREKADKMCLEKGLNYYDDAAMCPCKNKHGHKTADVEFHRFPKDFHQVVRRQLR